MYKFCNDSCFLSAKTTTEQRIQNGNRLKTPIVNLSCNMKQARVIMDATYPRPSPPPILTEVGVRSLFFL